MNQILVELMLFAYLVMIILVRKDQSVIAKQDIQEMLFLIVFG